ncbi:citrate lyase acyl carrier protein [Brooklawnia cerclae]|uniref:Citrate lyase acyl carrier protein n=1 Tax=Brooklawnia cerclae TaxID=349934 RepID=A0ABX0SG25_9ACTN|nr:citrate lyase subunit gamma (acyl carrier protein) [Brooklawnia cerclae]
MRIVRSAMAGTLESSDALVRVSAHDTLEVNITSTVQARYGATITTVVRETLDRLQIDTGVVTVDDKGALDCTLRARVETAVCRACDERPDWNVIVGWAR